MRQFLQFSFSLFICLLLFGISPVNAQTETPTNTPIPTSTPTFRPLFNTPTPDSYNFDCPGYQPIGWGSVTPVPSWLMNCSQCVTPMPGGWDWGDNPFESTPTPGSIVLTPTPETPTPTQAFIELESSYSMSGVTEQITPGYPHLSGKSEIPPQNLNPQNYTVRQKVFMSGQETTFYLQYDGTYYGTGKGPAYSGYFGGITFKGTCKSNTCKVTWNGIEYSQSNGDTIYFINDLDYPNDVDYLIQTGILDLKVSFTPTNEVYRGYEYVITRGGNFLWSPNTFSQLFTWDYEPIDLNPEPTPQAGHCAVVDDGENSQVPEEIGFSIPEFTIGTGSCVGVGDITIPMEWLQVVFPSAQNIYIPGMQACFVPIHFGNLAMFGLNIDLDLVALVIAAVVLIRLITRS